MAEEFSLEEFEKFKKKQTERIVAPQPMRSVPQEIAADRIGGAPEKSFVRRGAEAVVKSPALPIAGAVGFGIAGIPSGPGALGMSALGGGFGEATRQMAARGLGIDAPKTSFEAAKMVGKEALLSLAAEGTGQILFRGGAFALRPVLKKVGPKAIDFLSASTGVPKFAFQKIINKPSLLLKSTKSRIESSGAKIGQIIDDLISKEMTPDQAAVSLVERAFQTSGKSRNIAKDAALKIARGEAVEKNEVALANRAINRVISNTPDAEGKALLAAQKNIFRDFLADRIPELAKENARFSELKAGAAFRNLSRLNKSGETSRLGTMFLLGTILKNPAILATSPIVVGSIISAGSAATKAALSPAVNRPFFQAFVRNKVQNSFKSDGSDVPGNR